jgi:hypothetical protein
MSGCAEQGRVVSRSAAWLGFVLAAFIGLGFILVGAPAADAAPKATVAVFGGPGSGEGQFGFPAGVAVNQDTGDVYVVDVLNERVQQFDSDGVFIRAWGGNVADQTPDPPVGQVCSSGCSFGWAGTGEGVFSFGGQNAGIAVAPDGSVYVADAANNRVQQFTAEGEFVAMWGWGVQSGAETLEVCTSGCQAGIAGGGDGQLSNPIAVAVNPADGDVVVASLGDGRIQRFDSAGVYEAQFAASAPQSVAVDSTGAIYTVDSGNLFKYDADGNQLEFPIGSNPFSVTVDPASDHVFVAQYFLNETSGDYAGSEVRELDSEGTVIDAHFVRPELTDMYGVAVRSTTGRIYASQTFEDRIFILDDPVHAATIEPATDVGSRTATLNGTINPGGSLPIGYRFEVSANNGQTWTSFPETDVDIGAGTDPIPVTQLATGLQPGIEYRARLVATNQFGSRVISTETTFTTTPEPPVVETGPATQMTSTSALLTGDINANNTATTYHFEWGNTDSYGSSTPVPDASAGASGAPVTVTEQLTGLLPNTTYHYRLVATNIEGTTEGTDHTFRTRLATASRRPGNRGYELVSPADKIGGVGVGHWYGGPDAVGAVGIAAQDGERFAVRGQQGSTITDDGAFGYVNDWVFAERTPTGWAHRPAVSRRAHAPQPTTDITLTAASPNLELTGWGSAQILKLFPVMADWDATRMGSALLLRKWAEPQWELFGPTNPSQDVSEGLGSNDPISTGPKAVAADGSAVVASASGTRGLGLDDPRNRPDLEAGAGSVYLDEISGSFSDVFPGDDGVRELVNVCTGSGSERTVLPSGPCAADPTDPPAPRASLTHSGGASLSVGGVDPPPTVISTDGSRVFFMSPDPNLYQATSGTSSAQLFVRQRNSDGRLVTRWISRSAVEGQDTSLLGRTLFEGASRDGDKVFFRTTAPLTDDDPNAGCGTPCIAGTASTASWDLYMYDLPAGDDPAGGSLTRISRGSDGAGDCNVQTGTLRWLSDNASRAYFTCAAPLGGAAGSAEGTVTSPGGTTASDDASNLYLYDATDRADPSWTFVARLPRDGAFGNCDTSAKARGSLIGATLGGAGFTLSIFNGPSCVRGASDGSLVTFFTDGRLTGDDPDSASGDLYGYDVDRNELTRVSAAQGGAGGPYPCLVGQDTGVQCHGDTGIGTGFMALEMLGVGVHPGPGGDRLVFFESRSRLVAEDTDASYDVYQWREGDLSLISTGVSDPDGAFYVGNDRSGTNVYLATRDQLTWQDKDRVLDVYTARLGGGVPEPQPTVPCPPLTGGCRGGGAALVRPNMESSRPGGRNASPGRRRALSIGRLTRSQLRRAARTGTIRLRVRAARAGKLSVSARVRLRGKARVVGRASKRAAQPGLVSVSVRLNGRARAILARGRSLRVTVRVSQAGAKSRSKTVRLRRNAK